MKLFSRFNAFIGILGVLLVLTVIVGGSGGAFSEQDAIPTRTALNLIVYADLQGQIHTLSPDGSSASRVVSPETGFYTWPAWSPDGKSIVFSGTAPGDDGESALGLYISKMPDGEARVIYTNEPGMGPILPGMPHYPLWSPDSRHLSYMASEPIGLMLFLDDVTDEQPGTVVVRNSPLYASWSSDSKSLMVHSGAAHVLVDSADRQKIVEKVVAADGYRTPAWWPLSNKKIALLQNESSSSKLYIVDLDTAEWTFVDDIEEHAAFVWSPDGATLAVAKSRAREGLISRGITLYGEDGAEKEMGVEGNIQAFFWSPDSLKLAYLLVTRDRGVLRYMMVDMVTGDRRPLVDFTPTPDQSIAYDFFDQFAISHSPWSPDSRSLVLAGYLRHDGTAVSLNRQVAPQIYVVDAGKDPAVTSIADGFLAFWSPR